MSCTHCRNTCTCITPQKIIHGDKELLRTWHHSFIWKLIEGKYCTWLRQSMKLLIYIDADLVWWRVQGNLVHAWSMVPLQIAAASICKCNISTPDNTSTHKCKHEWHDWGQGHPWLPVRIMSIAKIGSATLYSAPWGHMMKTNQLCSHSEIEYV